MEHEKDIFTSPIFSPTISLRTSASAKLVFSTYNVQGEVVGTVDNYKNYRTSLVVQWVRICLPVQDTQVQSLDWEYPRALEQLSLCSTTTEPAYLEPVLCNKRRHLSEKPVHCQEE